MKRNIINPVSSFFQLNISFDPQDGSKPIETIYLPEQLPLDFRKLVISCSKVIFKRYHYGTVFSQKVLTPNNIFWMHVFQITEDVYLVPKATGLLISVHYMLKGNIEGMMNGRVFILKENTYQLYSLAEEVECLINLPRGYYISFHTTIPANIIPDMINTYKDDKNLKEVFEEGFRGNFYDYLFNISKQIKKNIHNILDYRRINTPEDKLARDVDWEEKLLALFGHYIEDKNSFIKQKEWVEKNQFKLSELKEYVIDNIFKNGDVEFYPLKLTNVLKKISLKNDEFRKAMIDKYGKTWKQFVQEIKLEKAACLLVSQPEQPVSDIAACLGYSVPTHFSRAFKKYFRLGPAEYRKKNMKS